MNPLIEVQIILYAIGFLVYTVTFILNKNPNKVVNQVVWIIYMVLLAVPAFARGMHGSPWYGIVSSSTLLCVTLVHLFVVITAKRKCR